MRLSPLADSNTSKENRSVIYCLRAALPSILNRRQGLKSPRRGLGLGCRRLIADGRYPMHITILAAGSRGDIQPYLALGVGLQAAGHRVRFAAFRNFALMVEPYGLEFWPVDADFQAIMGGEDGQGMIASSRNVLQLARGIARTVGPILTQLGDDFWRACQGTDLIFSGLNGVAFFGFEFAQKLGVPCINGSVVPLLSTRAWPNPMWPLRANLR